MLRTITTQDLIIKTNTSTERDTLPRDFMPVTWEVGVGKG